MEFLRRHPGIVIITAIVLVLVGIGFIPRPIAVDAVAVTRGRLTVMIEEEGRTRLVDHYQVSAPVDGFAERIDLEVGDTVEAGQVVGRIRPMQPVVLDARSRTEAEARRAAADAARQAAVRDLQAATADAEYARDDANRLQQLFDRGNIPLDTLQMAQVNARRTQARLESARFAVQIAEYELKAAAAVLDISGSGSGSADEVGIAIESPVSGRVLRILHESEGVVSRGTALLDVGDPASLEIEVDVLSRDAVRIDPGTRVALTRWGGDEALEGRVRTVEPVGFTRISALGVEEQRVLVIVDIVSPKVLWQRLGDGYRVEAAFILSDDDNVLQIPSSTLFRQNGQWAVYMIVNGRAEMRNVETGRRSGLVTEILDGVDEGALLINHPGDTLEPGSRVKPR